MSDIVVSPGLTHFHILSLTVLVPEGTNYSALHMQGHLFSWQERRKKQQWEIVHKRNETLQKISALIFARQYLANLLPSVFDKLRNSGFFYDPIERGLWTLLLDSLLC